MVSFSLTVFMFSFFLETKPHQDVLREENIKIVPITEVRGVRGNWNHVTLSFRACWFVK